MAEAIHAASPVDQVTPTEADIDRRTDEIVIGLVGAVGAGVSTTAVVLKELLERDYAYEGQIVKVSDLIKDNAGKVSHEEVSAGGANRVQDLQKIGTDLRSKFGDDYLASKAIELISISRADQGKTSESGTALSTRRFTIIDSLKHQDESKLLRRVYGGLYWQFTIFAPDEIRQSRLQDAGVDLRPIAGIFSRDQDDDDDHGQKVSKTAHLSDFFVRNDAPNTDRLKRVLERFLMLAFNISVVTPTQDEAGMYAAMSAANRSACLSRQVGAAIYSSSGDAVSVGWNDVPKANGGLYSWDDGDEDNRCFKWKTGLCHNDDKKAKLYDDIIEKLIDQKLLGANVDRRQATAALKKTSVKSLIEYSRSIHAEMEAIVSAARAGKEGIEGGKLYTTTFPCHNCARHIVAAGITEVYYVEPYSKSLAVDLHSDAISQREDEGKVSFLQYEGVGPRAMSKLFQHGVERKDNGRVKELEKATASPVLPPPIDGFSTHEARVLRSLQESEKADSEE